MTFDTPSSFAPLNFRKVGRIVDQLLTPVGIVAPDSTLLYLNNAATTLLGRTEAELLGQKMFAFVHPEDRARVVREMRAILDGAPAGGFTRYRLKAANNQGWMVIDCYAHNLIDDPDVQGIIVSVSEVTEQHRLSKALRALSNGNHVLVHADDEASLISNICQTIIESGQYMLAWVGYLENDEQQSVRMVASYGMTKELLGSRISWGDNEYGMGPTGLAIRTGQVQVIRDVRRSKRGAPWRREIEEYGVRTACGFPLVVNGVTIGALTIYGSDPHGFDTGEVELLTQLANDVAYGIGRIRDAEQLAKNEAHLREAERLAHIGHWEWDPSTDALEFMAEEMSQIYGTAEPGWRGNREEFLSFVAPEERHLVEELLDTTRQAGSGEVVARIIRPDGASRWVRMRAEMISAGPGALERMIGTSLDITVHIAAKQQLAESRQYLLAITNNMAEGMIATDAHGVITFANRAAGKLVGLDPVDIVGTPTGTTFHLKSGDDHTDSHAKCPLRQVWEGGDSLVVDFDTLIRRDGTTVPVAYSASPLESENLSGSVIVFEDITERAAEQLKVERELEKLAWVGRIRDALDDGRFVLYCQPIVDLTTYEVTQHELLLRMLGPDGRVVPPAHFLATAEEYGLITEIDRWVVGEAARLAARGHVIEFNLSAKSVADPHMLAAIVAALDVHGAAPKNLICEITETALMNDVGAAEAFVRGLNEIGCGVALDDFGAGYGGFSYLKRLPVSYLKIDREFVHDLAEVTSSRHVVAAVVNLAQAFGLKTIAEGAEDDETLRILRHLGVDHVQGFALGRPAPAHLALEQDPTSRNPRSS
ncbi:MAG TPA: EAL domain-containing protein [Acidimicrobiales bacterium]